MVGGEWWAFGPGRVTSCCFWFLAVFGFRLEGERRG